MTESEIIMDFGDNPRCILCGDPGIRLYHRGRSGREYLRCPSCGLVFVPPGQRPGPAEEFDRYERHQNSPDNQGYTGFLNRLVSPLDSRLEPGSTGLDFGSGPVPVLSQILTARGYQMNIYDPFYAADRSVFERDYDFITAVEVLEHLFDPGRELDNLWNCLRKGGYLGIMTEPVPGRREFAEWYYKDDITHVTFFSEKTFVWLARHWGGLLKYVRDNVIIFNKPV